MLLEAKERCEEVDCETEGPSLKPFKEYEFVLETPVTLVLPFSFQYPYKLDSLLHYWHFKKQVMEGKAKEHSFGRGDRFYFKVLEVIDPNTVKIETNYSSDNYELTSIDVSAYEVTVSNGAYVIVDQETPIQCYHRTQWKPTPEEIIEKEKRDKENAQQRLEEEELLKVKIVEVQEFLKVAPTLSTAEMKAVFTDDGNIDVNNKREIVTEIISTTVINGYWDYAGVSSHIRNKTLDSVKPDFQVIKDLGDGNYSLRILNNTDVNLDDNYLCFCYAIDDRAIRKIYGATVSPRKPFDDMFKKVDEQKVVLQQLKDGTYVW